MRKEPQNSSVGDLNISGLEQKVISEAPSTPFGQRKSYSTYLPSSRKMINFSYESCKTPSTRREVTINTPK